MCQNCRRRAQVEVALPSEIVAATYRADRCLFAFKILCALRTHESAGGDKCIMSRWTCLMLLAGMLFRIQLRGLEPPQLGSEKV